MFVLHPLALHLEHLLQHVTGAAFASVVGRYVLAQRLDLGACIGRTAGQPALAHDLPVGDVIAHVKYLIGLEVILGLELVEVIYLDA